MKALNLYGIGDLRYDDVPMPDYAEDEVLVKVRAVGICGSDIPRVFSKGTYHFPTIIGHEFSGEIVNAKDVSLIGRGVAVFPLIPCAQCNACKDQKYAQCKQYDYYGSRRDGGMSEYVAVKKKNLVFIPESVSYQVAAMSEPAAVALHAFRKAKMQKSESLVIFGVGPIALLMARFAKLAGIKDIILVARSKEKVEFARTLGFFQVVDSSIIDVSKYVIEHTNGTGASVCVEGTGTTEVLEMCLQCTANFGRVIALGNPLGEIALSQQSYWQILRKELQLIGTWNSSFSLNENDWQEVMNVMNEGLLDVEHLITHVFHLSEYKEAFGLMHEKKESYCKIMFVNEEAL